jgi:hypothetical protein
MSVSTLRATTTPRRCAAEPNPWVNPLDPNRLQGLLTRRQAFPLAAAPLNIKAIDYRLVAAVQYEARIPRQDVRADVPETVERHKSRVRGPILE